MLEQCSEARQARTFLGLPWQKPRGELQSLNWARLCKKRRDIRDKQKKKTAIRVYKGVLPAKGGGKRRAWMLLTL